MATTQATVHVPGTLWRAIQSLALPEGDPNTVILRAGEEYITATATRHGDQSGKYRALVQALSTPVADLHLSARSATALRTLTIRYVYELLQMTHIELFTLPNFGKKSLREVKDTRATLGLTWGMTLEDDAYSAAVVAAAARIEAARGGAVW